jgi:hypothetical protein
MLESRDEECFELGLGGGSLFGWMIYGADL